MLCRILSCADGVAGSRGHLSPTLLAAVATEDTKPETALHHSLTMPFGPNVVFTRSAMAIAPTKDACAARQPVSVKTRRQPKIARTGNCLGQLSSATFLNIQFGLSSPCGQSRRAPLRHQPRGRPTAAPAHDANLPSQDVVLCMYTRTISATPTCLCVRKRLPTHRHGCCFCGGQSTAKCDGNWAASVVLVDAVHLDYQ